MLVVIFFSLDVLHLILQNTFLVLMQVIHSRTQARVRTSKLLQGRELYGNVISSNKGKCNFEEEFRKTQASRPNVCWFENGVLSMDFLFSCWNAWFLHAYRATITAISVSKYTQHLVVERIVVKLNDTHSPFMYAGLEIFWNWKAGWFCLGTNTC